MCDTFSFFSKTESRRSFFAKNSDRTPGEPQIIEFVQHAEKNFQTDFLHDKLKKYTEGPFIRLKEIFNQFEHPYAAIISRPTWIWGAEMGMNSRGVAIGNEAVFSKQKLVKNGLLGMDILRLALHNAATADEAAQFIISLLERYGQDGNGSYTGTLRYHNSFLIKDPEKVIVLESTAKSWAVKEVRDFTSISNSYTLRNDYKSASPDLQNKNLKKKFESKFYTFFSQGDFRSHYTREQIQKQDKNLGEVFSILRAHLTPHNKQSRGMKSICVHPGILVKSETTASMVVDYIKNRQIIWHTSAPNPCVSIYKPIFLQDGTTAIPFLNTMHDSEQYFLENRALSSFFLKHPVFFKAEIESLRNKLEQEFMDIIYQGLDTKTDEQLAADCILCYKKEQAYKSTIHQIIQSNYGK